MKDIRDVDNPVIGKYYWVPSVTHSHHLTALYGPDARLCGASKNGYVAVRGDLHNDPEISFDQYHWHYDIRFLPVREDGAYAYGRYWAINSVLNVDRYKAKDGRGIVDVNSLTMKKRKLLTLGLGHDFNAHFDSLVIKYRNEKAVIKNNCLTCPHRGTRLDQSDIDQDGNFVCPLHMLKWSPSGVLVEPPRFVPLSDN